MTERPKWSISRAAEECGVSRDTIKRRRAAGAFPNATQDQQGRWLIPLTDLLAVGLQPQMTGGTALGQKAAAPGFAPGATFEARESELVQQVQLLQVQLDAERQLRVQAERNADDLRQSLRMLEPALNPMVDEPRPTVRPPKRHWWQRSNQNP